MSTNDIPHDPLDASVETVGSFSGYHKLTVGGYHVPHAVVYPTRDGNVDLVIDDRFSATFTREELQKFGWILAQAMAVSAGYSCHGHNSRPVNPFRVRMIGISTVMTELPEGETAQEGEQEK